MGVSSDGKGGKGGREGRASAVAWRRLLRGEEATETHGVAERQDAWRVSPIRTAHEKLIFQKTRACRGA